MKGHNYGGLCRKCSKIHTHPYGMLGKTHSEKTTQQMGEKSKGKLKSKIHAQNISKGLTGINRSEKTNLLNSLARIRYYSNPENRIKQGNSRRGKSLEELVGLDVANERKRKSGLGVKNAWKSKSQEDKDKIGKNLSLARKKYLKIHPENHPLVIIAKNRKEGRGYISKGQRNLYDYIKILCPEAVLEYPVITNNTTRYLDIGIPSLHIGFEYDGRYWHQDKSYDDKRDKELEEMGWEIIHVLGE